MAVISELAVNIVAKTQGFEAGVKKSLTSLQQFKKGIESTTASLNAFNRYFKETAEAASRAAEEMANRIPRAYEKLNRALAKRDLVNQLRPQQKQGWFSGAGEKAMRMGGMGQMAGAAGMSVGGSAVGAMAGGGLIAGVGLAMYREVDKQLQSIVENAQDLQARGIFTAEEIGRAKEYAGAIGLINQSVGDARKGVSMNFASMFMGDSGVVPKFGERKEGWNTGALPPIGTFYHDMMVNAMERGTGAVTPDQITAAPGSHKIPDFDTMYPGGYSSGPAKPSPMSGFGGLMRRFSGGVESGLSMLAPGADGIGSFMGGAEQKRRAYQISLQKRMMGIDQQMAGLAAPASNNLLLANTSAGYAAMKGNPTEQKQLAELKKSRELLTKIAGAFEGGDDPFVIAGP